MDLPFKKTGRTVLKDWADGADRLGGRDGRAGVLRGFHVTVLPIAARPGSKEKERLNGWSGVKSAPQPLGQLMN